MLARHLPGPNSAIPVAGQVSTKSWQLVKTLDLMHGYRGFHLDCCELFHHLLCGWARVGNELGAMRPKAARTAAVAGMTMAPLLWAVIAVILAEPHLQRLVLLLYLDGSDPVLWRALTRLLLITVAVELFDGLQTVLGGVVQVRRAGVLS